MGVIYFYLKDGIYSMHNWCCFAYTLRRVHINNDTRLCEYLLHAKGKGTIQSHSN